MSALNISLVLLIAGAITTILTIKYLFKYLIKPYIQLLRFKKYKGGVFCYKPLQGTVGDLKSGERDHGDAQYNVKKRLIDFPEIRFVASPFLDRAMVTLYDADLIKQFLNKESTMCKKCIGLMMNDEGNLLMNGLVFSEGETWKKQRKLISQVFHFDYMNDSVPTIRNIVNEWIERNTKEASNTSPAVVNVSKELKMFTSTVLWRILFGEVKFSQDHRKIVELILELLETQIELSISSWNVIFGHRFFELGLREIDRKWKRNRKLVNEIFFTKLENLRKQIAERKAQSSTEDIKTSEQPRKNLIELLIEQPEGLPDLEIVGQIFTFFFAGTDTTSELLAFTHYMLATNQNAQQKLREEVLAIVGKTGDIKYEHVAKMEYLAAVIKETLRMGAPASGIVPRHVNQNFSVGDIQFKKGDVIDVASTGVGYNAKYFKNPKEFRPERWVEKAEPGTVDTSTHLPFSAGARRCIGEQLSLLESKILLCELVRRFEIKLQMPYELKMGLGSVYHAKPDVHAIYTPIE